MAKLKRTNILRRRIMGWLTKNIGSSHNTPKHDPNLELDINRVLICRPNHRLGNLLLMTPLLKEVEETFPDCKIDVFVKGGLAPILFESYDSVDKIIQLPKKPFKELIKYAKGWLSIRKRRYDLVINSDKNSSSGRLSTQFAKSKYKVFGDLTEATELKYADHQHIAKYPIYGLRHYLSQIGHEQPEMPVPTLDLKLTQEEIAQGKEVMHNIVDGTKKTICIFTFATGNKCYPESWWMPLYEQLKETYPDYNILEVLPVENVSQIGFKAPSFYSKDIREIGAVFTNTEVFIGADSGMMHLASASRVPTVGLFMVTDVNIYQPYGNGSIAVNTNISDASDIIKEVDRLIHTK